MFSVVFQKCETLPCPVSADSLCRQPHCTYCCEDELCGTLSHASARSNKFRLRPQCARRGLWPAPKRGSGNPHSNNSLANPQPGRPRLGSPMLSACLPPCAHWLQLGPGGLAARGAAPLPRDVAVGAAEPSHLSLPPHPASLGEGVGQGGREGTLWPCDPWSCPSLPPRPAPLRKADRSRGP